MNGTMHQRKPGVWEITVSLGVDADGIRRRKSRTVYGTKAEAQKQLRAFVEEVERTRSLLGMLLFADWLRIWHRDEVLPRRRIKTQERYAGIIERALIPHLGHIPLADLSPNDIEDAYRRLQDGGLSARTVHLVHCVTSGACKHAVRKGKVDRNVAELVRLPAVTKSEVIPPEIETVLKLLDLAAAEAHPLFPFLFVLTYTGMRKGEAWGLVWCRVDLDQGTIEVVDAVVRTQHQGLVRNPPKTPKGLRTIDLPDIVVAFLRRHRTQQGPDVGPHDLVFPASDGGMMPETSMMRQVKELGARVGAPDINFHAFRHFHASVCLEDDESGFTTSRRLGHSSITITYDTYGHLLKGRQKALAQGFAEKMRPPDQDQP